MSCVVCVCRVVCRVSCVMCRKFWTSVRPSVRPSVRHEMTPETNGLAYKRQLWRMSYTASSNTNNPIVNVLDLLFEDKTFGNSPYNYSLTAYLRNAIIGTHMSTRDIMLSNDSETVNDFYLNFQSKTLKM